MAEEEAGFTVVDKRVGAVTEAAGPAESIDEIEADESVESVGEIEADESVVFAEEIETERDSRPDDTAGPEGAQAAPNVWVLLHYSLQLFAQHAWFSMGLVADPATGQPRPNLPEARVAIDAVADLASRLETAPEDVIPSNARRDIRNLVNDLRLNYVNQKQAAPPAETPA